MQAAFRNLQNCCDNIAALEPAVDTFLSQGGMLCMRDKFEQTLLMKTAVKGDLKCVQFLISKGSDINAKDSKGRTCISLAAVEPTCSEIVKYLLEFGADVNLTSSTGATPLHIACDQDAIENVKLLATKTDISLIDTFGNTALHRACSNNSLKSIQHLVDCGISIDVQNNSGSTALHCAAEKDYIDAVRLLVTGTKADLTIKNREGNTITRVGNAATRLAIAAIIADAGKSDLPAEHALSNSLKPAITDPVQRLRASSRATADRNATSDKLDVQIAASSSSRSRSESNGAVSSVFDLTDEGEILARLKARPDLVSVADCSTGKTPLHLACEKNYFSLINLLLRRQVNLDISDVNGKTALHLCSSEKSVRLLCSHGANVHILDKQLLSAAHNFIATKMTDCVQAMLSYDFDPSLAHTMDPSSLELVSHQSCLHYTAQCEDLEALTILVTESKSLGDINVRDEEGNTVLHRIAEIDAGTPAHQKAIMVLLDRGVLPDARNNAGASALHMLCANRSFGAAEMIEPLIELLLNMNCDPNVTDYSGCTPLIIACAHREWSVCKVLMQFGADMNVRKICFKKIKSKSSYRI